MSEQINFAESDLCCKKEGWQSQNVTRDVTQSTVRIQQIINWDNRPFTGKWPENQHSTRGTEVKKTIRKKPKRIRTAYSTDQLRVLEKIYSTSKYIDAKRRKELSESLNIGDKALKIWFQNRRMKEKKESSESSCDTSSEIMSCQSPFKGNELEEALANVPISNYNELYEPAQYQFPSYCNYNGDIPGVQCQNGYSYFQDGACFGGDSSVYPTQYYPTFNEDHCPIGSGNNDAFGYAQYNGQDNWYANSCELAYFQSH